MQIGDATWEARIVAAMHLLARTPLPKSASDRKSAELWEVRHRNFHYALVSACGSSWRLRFWGTLTDHSERYRKLRLLRRKRNRRACAECGRRSSDRSWTRCWRATSRGRRN